MQTFFTVLNQNRLAFTKQYIHKWKKTLKLVSGWVIGSETLKIDYYEIFFWIEEDRAVFVQ